MVIIVILVLIFTHSKSGEELKQQNSELSEKLGALLSENAAMKLELGDLHKKLEMAELMIQQVSLNTNVFLQVKITYLCPEVDCCFQVYIFEESKIGFCS